MTSRQADRVGRCCGQVVASTLGLALLAAAAGCDRERAEVLDKARWLCAHNLAERPVLEAFGERRAEELVEAADLAYLRGRADGGSQDLAGAVAVKLAPVVQALGAVMARHTRCDLDYEREGSSLASVRGQADGPDFALGGLDALLELIKLPDQASREARLEQLVAAASGRRQSPIELRFVARDGVWRARYDLAGRDQLRRARERAALEGRERELAAAREARLVARQRLAALRVESSRYWRARRNDVLLEPHLELGVHNQTGAPIVAVGLRARVLSLGRDEPWLDEPLEHRPPAPLAAGARATWDVQPNLFSAWGRVQVPPGATVAVEVLRADGTSGLLWDASDLPAIEAELAQVRAALARR